MTYMCDGHTLCMQHTWEAMLVSISHFSQNSNFAIRNTAMVQSALFSAIFTILGKAAPLSAQFSTQQLRNPHYSQNRSFVICTIP